MNIVASYPQCPKCHSSMGDGKVLLNIFGGYSDFPGDSIVTMSPTGDAKLVDCWKCSICGHSIVK